MFNRALANSFLALFLLSFYRRSRLKVAHQASSLPFQSQEGTTSRKFHVSLYRRHGSEAMSSHERKRWTIQSEHTYLLQGVSTAGQLVMQLQMLHCRSSIATYIVGRNCEGCSGIEYFVDWCITHNSGFRCCPRYWLGVPLHSTSYCCPECRSTADPFGDHKVGCGGNGDRTARHNAIRDVLFLAARSAALAPTREAPSVVPDSQSRPADILLPTWSRGRPAALDVTVISPQPLPWPRPAGRCSA